MNHRALTVGSGIDWPVDEAPSQPVATWTVGGHTHELLDLHIETRRDRFDVTTVSDTEQQFILGPPTTLCRFRVAWGTPTYRVTLATQEPFRCTFALGDQSWTGVFSVTNWGVPPDGAVAVLSAAGRLDLEDDLRPPPRCVIVNWMRSFRLAAEP